MENVGKNSGSLRLTIPIILINMLGVCVRIAMKRLKRHLSKNLGKKKQNKKGGKLDP